MGLPGRAPAGLVDVGMEERSGFALIFGSGSTPLSFPPPQRCTEYVNSHIPAAWPAKAQILTAL